MSRSRVARRLASIAVLAVASHPAARLAAQVVREGEVVEVRGETARVDLAGEGAAVPAAGDSVQILDPTVPGLDPVPVRGAWVVSRAGGGSVWIAPVGPAASLQPGYLARIFASESRPSTDPVEDPDAGVTLERVLERYYEAIGGREAWTAVRSIRVRGSVEDDETAPLSFEQVVARGHRLWGRVWSEAYTRTRGFDGERAWIVGEPADGSPPSVRIVDHEGQLALARFEADLDGPLVGHEEEDVELELLGIEPVEGAEAYVIGVSPESGFYHRVFVDAERFVILKLMVPNPEDLENERDAWIQIYGDYRAVDGLLVPHLRQVVAGGAVKYVIDRVEFDVPLDETLFAAPDQPIRR